MLRYISLFVLLFSNIVYATDKSIILSGGCFWCTESDLEALPGVTSVVSGYTGGTADSATYRQVSSGTTKHRESAKITYDSDRISLSQILNVFLRTIDPNDATGSFVDRGYQYTAAIYYGNDEEKQLADRFITTLRNSSQFGKQPIAIAVEPASEFFPAEEYHQDYYKKNSFQYKFYRSRSGRDQFITRVWDKIPQSFFANELGNDVMSKSISIPAEERFMNFQKPDQATLKKTLSSEAYYVTQEEGTERPYTSSLNDNKEKGIYVDIVSGEPLFSSADKYDSGTGWPSFTKPISDSYITLKDDYKLFVKRTEVRSKYGDSHLGHVFNDGPAPTGLRYCMNGVALRFIPLADMEQEGYGEYISFV